MTSWKKQSTRMLPGREMTVAPDRAWSPAPRRLQLRRLSKLLLVNQVDAEDAVPVAVGDRGPCWGECPFNPNDLRVRIFERSHVGKGQIGRDLLLQCDPRLREVRAAGEGRIDFQLADAEDAL